MVLHYVKWMSLRQIYLTDWTKNCSYVHRHACDLKGADDDTICFPCHHFQKFDHILCPTHDDHDVHHRRPQTWQKTLKHWNIRPPLFSPPKSKNRVPSETVWRREHVCAAQKFGVSVSLLIRRPRQLTTIFHLHTERYFCTGTGTIRTRTRGAPSIITSSETIFASSSPSS